MQDREVNYDQMADLGYNLFRAKVIEGMPVEDAVRYVSRRVYQVTIESLDNVLAKLQKGEKL